MPKRTDIKTILLIGSGPIVIGQGCEFDYSGTQACKALRAEGFRIVLVNSNPATIMTDPELADRTYIEPITPEAVRKILQKQKDIGDAIHAVLPTLGGQTALNCACKLWDDGVFQAFGVEMIGADRRVIHRAEDRQIFKEICEGLGLKLPKAKTVTTLADAEEFLKEIGLPAVIRPAFTLGGTGGGIAYNRDEFTDIITRGLRASMIGQVQIDQSVIGWKEYELEVVRDKKDNCIIVCGIENIDPMGVHTGDSITVAPIQTLSDKEYQAMRDASLAIMRAVGVETGGSNVQFAVNPAPKDGKFEMVVVEMNPRVSRSSALASKATGFPIAKIAAKLAIGYTLDELRNDITGTTSACFEPSIDYVVTKIPRWTFEKFPEADETLTTQMKSVGEAMAIGRTFAESFQKAIRSMEVKRFGLGLDRNDKWLASRRADAQGRTADGQKVEWPIADDKLRRKLAVPSQGRLYYVRYAFKMGMSTDEINSITNIDRWFLDQIKKLVEFEDVLTAYTRLEDVPADTLRAAKTLGYSDAQLANLYLGSISPKTILQVRAHRKGLKIEPVYKLVDTCAAEFAAVTPYYYSTYETPFTLNGEEIVDDEIRVTDTKKVIILGGGPNRIGQGIEFDYCCCHAAFAADELGLESVMINSNPETVSTDYDTSDLLFFEPLTMEDVLNVIERLNGKPLASQGFVAVGTQPLTEEISQGLMRALAPLNVRGGSYLGVVHLNPQGYEHVVAAADGRVFNVRARDFGEVTDVTGFPQIHRRAFKENFDRAVAPGYVLGAVVQFGGQTPLNLAHGLQMAGAPIIGTSVDSIDLAEDRKRFDALLVQLGLSKPPSGTARTLQQAVEIANTIGYPVLVRPSYVLGGRGMEICSDEKSLVSYMSNAVRISEMDDAPVLIDRFLDDATEVDVDVVADFDPAQPIDSPAQSGRQAVVCGVMEHIEQAGIHSGDSACAIPAYALPETITSEIRRISRELARHLRVQGLMNVQLAVKDGKIYMLEVNPRASRTSPFVGKATGTPWPRIAAKVMMGKTLAEMNVKEVTTRDFYSVKESVFPFSKFPGVDVVLGPEMRSTGEVMGIDKSFPIAFAKSQMASGTHLPLQGNVFVSVRERDRAAMVPLVKDLLKMGFTVCASSGTGSFLKSMNLDVRVLPKIAESVRPNVLDLMQNGELQLIINTPTKTGWQTDEGRIRASAVRLGVPMITTTTGAWATVRAIEALRAGDWGVAAIQDYFPKAATAEPKVQTVGRSPARV
ncbi:MAG TPA: carbamoyl-phosphate synthase large subunit [Phycisphaerales bacterium]|nr:carbamoyl-phosphate synthase large subunit [Phycisphaerales bacterium]